MGDDLVINNLKQTTNKLLGKFSEEISSRLDEMDEKIGKFYDILLIEYQEKKKKVLSELEKGVEQTMNQNN